MIALMEMAMSLPKATSHMMDRAFTVLEHFLKVYLYPDNINQNKWRNEIATKMQECGRVKNTSTNKKFNESVYWDLFTTYCSNVEELEENVQMECREFLQDGLHKVDVSKISYEDMFNKFNSMANKAVKLMASKQIFTRDDYRQQVIDTTL